MTTLTSTSVAFEHILVPTDFSEASERALGYAKSVARRYQSDLFLIHVNQPINPVSPPEATWIDMQPIQVQLGEQMEQAGMALRSEGFRAKALSVPGTVQEEILSSIIANKIDLVVMGTHGKRGLDRLILGSETEDVQQRVNCPILVIGPAVPASGKDAWHPRRVICATTLDPTTAAIPAYAYLLAQQHQADFLLVHLQDLNKPEMKTDWSAFEEAMAQHLPSGIKANRITRTLFSDSLPGHQIVEVAKERHADLIVMGARIGSAVATHFIRGTSAQVYAEAHCPVLVMHS